ncbi:MAG: hypothetical protein SFY69_08085 [Planctomycetota bacterium]|nr:hypothetical protein [Planctomycetota bacterium]
MARKKSRQIVLMGKEGAGDAPPLGKVREVRDTLAGFNTSGDGSAPGGMGLERLYGPGMVVEIPTSVEPVTQVIATMNDEETAFPVLMKLCKLTGWRMMDVESGRVLRV